MDQTIIKEYISILESADVNKSDYVRPIGIVIFGYEKYGIIDESLKKVIRSSIKCLDDHRSEVSFDLFAAINGPGVDSIAEIKDSLSGLVRLLRKYHLPQSDQSSN
jgi:hypothetical protein